MGDVITSSVGHFLPPREIGSKFLTRTVVENPDFLIHHRNALTVKAWEDAVQGLFLAHERLGRNARGSPENERGRQSGWPSLIGNLITDNSVPLTESLFVCSY